MTNTNNIFQYQSSDNLLLSILPEKGTPWGSEGESVWDSGAFVLPPDSYQYRLLRGHGLFKGYLQNSIEWILISTSSAIWELIFLIYSMILNLNLILEFHVNHWYQIIFEDFCLRDMRNPMMKRTLFWIWISRFWITNITELGMEVRLQ